MSERLSKNQYFLQMLELITARSTCVRRRVGAIITDRDGHVLSTGYNGTPRGLAHCIDFPCAGSKDESGNTSRCESVHAEANAILQCSRLDLAKKIYTSCSPCFECAKLIANTYIDEVITLEIYPGEGNR